MHHEDKTSVSNKVLKGGRFASIHLLIMIAVLKQNPVARTRVENSWYFLSLMIMLRRYSIADKRYMAKVIWKRTPPAWKLC